MSKTSEFKEAISSNRSKFYSSFSILSCWLKFYFEFTLYRNTVVHPIQSGIVLNDKSSTVNARFGNELIKANFDLEDVKLADIRQ